MRFRNLWIFASLTCVSLLSLLFYSLLGPPSGESQRALRRDGTYDVLLGRLRRGAPPGPRPRTYEIENDDEIRDDLKTQKNVEYLTVDDVPSFRVREINCARLFANEKSEIYRGYEYQRSHEKVPLSDDDILSMTNDCPRFIETRNYATKAASAEELRFPIAFSVLIYRDLEQFERLLRMIYRPQNLYCVHVEKTASASFRSAATSIADCFDNVFIASRSIEVKWGFYSILEPEFVCMEDLWRRSKKWLYFINLTGQEFPLRTNGEIVKILKAYNGANNMEGTVLRQSPELRSYLDNPPRGMIITKGSVHVTASRAFVDYVLHDPFALEFREWIQQIPVPDELFFSSLNHNPDLGVPGSYKGIPETDTRQNMFITRYKNWGMWPFSWPCNGRVIRQICIFGIGDLSLLASRPELFANKFYLHQEPLALDCMEELYFNKTREEIAGKGRFDVGFYENMDFVKNHV